MASSKSEKNELKRLGARPTKNSGRGKHDKGDGIITDGDVQDFLTVDVKEYGKGYRITPENWAKVNTDAVNNRTDPALFLVLGEDEPKTRLVVLNELVFLDMLEVYKQHQFLYDMYVRCQCDHNE